jgi:hypothetical protein
MLAFGMQMVTQSIPLCMHASSLGRKTTAAGCSIYVAI